MEKLVIRNREECRYASISLGEIMLRLDPGEGRISTTRQFRVWEGGGEYNVARGLRKCFRLPTAVVTAFADNAVGRLVEVYMGVLQLFVRETRETGANELRLRLLPVSLS